MPVTRIHTELMSASNARMLPAGAEARFDMRTSNAPELRIAGRAKQTQ